MKAASVSAEKKIIVTLRRRVFGDWPVYPPFKNTFAHHCQSDIFGRFCKIGSDFRKILRHTKILLRRFAVFVFRVEKV